MRAIMTIKAKSNIVGSTRLERRATLVLAVATVLVGASIVADDDLARALNGVAGLTWFAASAMFIIDARRRGASIRQWVGILALTAIVAFAVRPSDIVLATIGFTSAAFIAGMVNRRDPMLWAKLVPALYLPLHIGTAVLKAAGRSALGLEASIRAEPPPTAVIVPAVMLVAAIVGGLLAAIVINRQGPQASTTPQSTGLPNV
jgi:hypothetical protein